MTAYISTGFSVSSDQSGTWHAATQRPHPDLSQLGVHLAGWVADVKAVRSIIEQFHRATKTRCLDNEHQIVERLAGLEGDFTAALITRDGRTMLVVRPPTSSYTVYYRRWPTKHLASSPGQLGPHALAPDTEVLPMLATEKGMPATRSWYQDVHRVAPGEVLVWQADRDTPRIKLISIAASESSPLTSDQLVESFRATSAAISLSYGPGLNLLSGGVDSSLIAAAFGTATTHLHYTLNGFDAFAVDKKNVENFAQNAEVDCAFYDLSDDLGSLARYLGDPSGDQPPQTHVPVSSMRIATRSARLAGQRWVSSGLAADQVFAVSPVDAWFASYPRLRWLIPALTGVRPDRHLRRLPGSFLWFAAIGAPLLALVTALLLIALSTAFVDIEFYRMFLALATFPILLASRAMSRNLDLPEPLSSVIQWNPVSFLVEEVVSTAGQGGRPGAPIIASAALIVAVVVITVTILDPSVRAAARRGRYL